MNITLALMPQRARARCSVHLWPRMRRPPCFLWEGRAEEWQETTTRCAGMSTSCGAVVEKLSAGRASSGDPRRVPGAADVCCDDGRTNHAEDEEGSAHG